MLNFAKKTARVFPPLFACALLSVSCAGKDAGFSSADLQNRKNLAASYARGGDFTGAIAEISKVEKQTENDPEAHLIKGIAYYGLKDLERAEKSYKKALEIESGYTKAVYNLCGLYVKMNRPDSAIERCSEVAGNLRYPLRYAAFVNMAKAYELKNDTVSAERFMKESLKLEPLNIYSRNEYGKLLMKLSRDREAALQFKTALKIAPGYGEARLNLALSLIETGDLNSACSQLRRVSLNKPPLEVAQVADEYTEKVCGNE